MGTLTNATDRGLEQRGFILSQLWGLDVQDQAVHRAGVPRGLLLHVETAAFSQCPHRVVPLCVCVLSSSPQRTPGSPNDSSCLNRLFTDPILKYSHILRLCSL